MLKEVKTNSTSRASLEDVEAILHLIVEIILGDGIIKIDWKIIKMTHWTSKVEKFCERCFYEYILIGGLHNIEGLCEGFKCSYNQIKQNWV